jgi:hypothetical protein
MLNIVPSVMALPEVLKLCSIKFGNPAKCASFGLPHCNIIFLVYLHVL